MKGKCSKNRSGNCLTSFNAALFTNQQFSPELSPCFLQWEGMLHFPAIHSPASTETPIWRSGWGHPQHRQKYGNTSLAPAQACQEHRGGGCINRTTEILAWLWSTKPILTHQTALDNNLLCKNSSAAANWEQNLMEWLCSDRSQHVTPPHITYKCNPIYKNTLYSCRDIKSPNPATEIFFFLNQQHMILLPSLQSRYPDFLTTHPPAQPFCSHTAGFFWGFSDKMQELFTQDFLHTQSMPWHQALSSKAEHERESLCLLQTEYFSSTSTTGTHSHHGLHLIMNPAIPTNDCLSRGWGQQGSVSNKQVTATADEHLFLTEDISDINDFMIKSCILIWQFSNKWQLSEILVPGSAQNKHRGFGTTSAVMLGHF